MNPQRFDVIGWPPWRVVWGAHAVGKICWSSGNDLKRSDLRHCLPEQSCYDFYVPGSYVIDKEHRLIISTAGDPLTFREITDHQNLLINDPGFDRSFNQLIDMTAVKSLEISVEQAKMLARREVFAATSRRAWVATEAVVYGMGRLMQAYHEAGRLPDRVGVFRDRDTALRWLGLSTLPK